MFKFISLPVRTKHKYILISAALTSALVCPHCFQNFHSFQLDLLLTLLLVSNSVHTSNFHSLQEEILHITNDKTSLLPNPYSGGFTSFLLDVSRRDIFSCPLNPKAVQVHHFKTSFILLG